ncbi:MAG: cupin domain-containing protein [Patescibacteria group bacterium]|jgi:quercetin dioxygenase-like cupin family protein
MDVQEIKIFKSDERGIIYDCDKVKFIARKKGSISADHVHDGLEVHYLFKGEIELTVGSETKIVKAPAKITIQPNEYHRILALTDIEIIGDREGEE